MPCTTQHKNIEVQEIIPLELTLVVWGDFDENPPTVDIASPQLKNESNDKDNTMKPEDFGKLFSWKTIFTGKTVTATIVRPRNWETLEGIYHHRHQKKLWNHLSRVAQSTSLNGQKRYEDMLLHSSQSFKKHANLELQFELRMTTNRWRQFTAI